VKVTASAPHFHGKMRPPRPERRLPARLEKAYVKLAEGEKMIEYAENL